MNAYDKELMGKIQKNILKRRLKAKTVSVTHPDVSNVWISNYVKIIDKQHVYFDPPRGLKNVLNVWKIGSDWKCNIQQKKLLKDKKKQRIALSKNN